MTTTPHQYSIALIQRDANGSIVQQRASDGYINATALCQAAGKRIAKYLENDGTKEFLAELSADVRIRTSELTQSVRDGFLRIKVLGYIHKLLSTCLNGCLQNLLFKFQDGFMTGCRERRFLKNLFVFLIICKDIF